MNNGEMIYVWSDPVFVVSNFDPCEENRMYPNGCVAVTAHYDGEDMDKAGSLSHDGALFIGQDELPDLIAALQEFVK